MSPPKFTFDLRTRGLLGTPEIVRLRLEQLGIQEVIVTLPDVIDSETLHLLAQRLK